MSKVMHLENLYDFSLVRYQPNSIILLDKHSRKPYQFHQMINFNNMLPDILHPFLLRPILYKSGVLYARGCENLSSLLDSRRRDYNPNKYSIQEILNTFQPVLECLEFVHQKGAVYGNLSAEHITFFENGQILLKDWLYKKSEHDLAQCTKVKDMRDVGYILASVASLICEDEIKKLSNAQILSKVMESYTLSFCSALAILLGGHSKYYPIVLNLITNQSNEIKIADVKPLLEEAIQLKNSKERQKIKLNETKQVKEKQLKEVENQKTKIQTPKRDQMKNQSAMYQTASIQGSPTKKFNINTPNKKIIRLEDSENKKVFNEQIKKRQIEKITKIIERSNAFVNQLMARKNNDKKHLNTVKLNNSLLDPQNTKKATLMKQSPKIGSPSKRLRSISKKK